MGKVENMEDIVIIGAGGFGREVQWLIERINESEKEKTGRGKFNIKGYIDDGVKAGTVVDGYEVLGTIEYLKSYGEPLSVACAIGNSKTRKKVINKIKDNKNLKFPNLIDPSVKKSGRIEMGVGNIICADCILTVDIVVSDFCILNLDCTVGHDAELEAYVTLYPSVNISGAVSIGRCTEIGTGSSIIQGISVGDGVIIGAGSVVIRDCPDECTAVGVPCKPVKFHE